MTLACFELAKILIIDDEEANVRLLERILHQEGFYNLTLLTHPAAVLQTVVAMQPDLILIDLHMPDLDGFQVLESLRSVIDPALPIPIIMLTADTTPHVRWRALGLGAKDFLIKPFDMVEVVFRIRNLLETRSLHMYMYEHNAQLEQQVQERTQHLEEAQDELLARLALTAEYRDDDTGMHSQRVGKLAGQIASQLGLTDEEVDWLQRAAPLHDLGKVAVPDHILLKPSSLTMQEFIVIKQHSTIGAKILADSQFPLLKIAAEIAYSHHERWDGEGYPCGLAGTAIPLRGRIVAVADAFDVMTHTRPYKTAVSIEAAANELRRNSGTQFDPTIVDACFAVLIEDLLLDAHYGLKSDFTRSVSSNVHAPVLLARA
jgi:putative two-component system response regulator